MTVCIFNVNVVVRGREGGRAAPLLCEMTSDGKNYCVNVVDVEANRQSSFILYIKVLFASVYIMPYSVYFINENIGSIYFFF